MISFVAHSINWCVDCVLSLLAAAAFIGQTIVTIVAGLLSLLASVCAFIANVYEDNRNLFTMEVPTMVLEAPATVGAHFVEAADVIGTYLSNIYYYVTNPICEGIDFFFSNLGYSAATVKKFFIIIGDSLWLIITFIPVQLPALLGEFVSWLIKTFVDGVVTAYMSLLKVTNFLTDVPLHSMVGIVSAVIIVRLLIDFQVDILSFVARSYWWTARRLTVYYYTIYNYFMDDEMRLINQIVQERRPVPVNHELDRRRREEDAVDERGEALCVVCQERQKCVLILPCRHICLCCECCVRLYNYQRTCPICRTFICHSVNVYY